MRLGVTESGNEPNLPAGRLLLLTLAEPSAETLDPSPNGLVARAQLCRDVLTWESLSGTSAPKTYGVPRLLAMTEADWRVEPLEERALASEPGPNLEWRLLVQQLLRQDQVQAVCLQTADETSPDLPAALELLEVAATIGCLARWRNGASEKRIHPPVKPVSNLPPLPIAPLVSILTPTRNRSPHLFRLYDCFQQQTYPHCQWVILDDSPAPDPFFQTLADSRVRYIHAKEPLSLGEKRNRLAALADGEVLAHWDDDDYYTTGYVAAMLARLGDRDLVKLTSWYGLSIKDQFFYYWDTAQMLSRHFQIGPRTGVETVPMGRRAASKWLWAFGYSLVYRRALWQTVPFEPVHGGEDYRFTRSALLAGARIGLFPDETGLLLNLIHRHNTNSLLYPNYRLPLSLLPRIFGEAILGQEPFSQLWREVQASRPAFLSPEPKNSINSGDILLFF